MQNYFDNNDFCVKQEKGTRVNSFVVLERKRYLELVRAEIELSIIESALDVSSYDSEIALKAVRNARTKKEASDA